MKREELKNLLPDITEEQLNQIMSWNGDDINREKQAAGTLKTQLEDATGKLKSFDGVDVAALNQQITDLQNQLNQQKLDAAIERALQGAKAVDTDYLAFKLRSGDTLEVDEKGELKNAESLIADLKTKYPDQFAGDKDPKPIPIPLPDGDPGEPEPRSLADALRQAYEKPTE